MRLTTLTVPKAKLPAGKSDHVEWDDDIPGFGLRIRAGGSKTLIFQYKLGAKQRRMVLGKAGAVNVAKVRETAEEYHHRVRLGEDPASDRIEAKRQASETFLLSAKEFLTTRRELYRPSSYREIDRHLMLHAKPLHHLPLAKIILRDIADLIDAVARQSGDVTANRVRSSLSVFFSWAIQHGRADANPVVNVEKKQEQSRDRVLTPSELRLIWKGLGDDNQYAAIIRLLALTGQRASEIAGLRRGEVHDDQIILPGERTKNGRDHVLPLSGIAAQILEQQPNRNGRDLIFGDCDGPFSGWSRCKARLDQRIKEANGGKPIDAWTPHDLRRTFATYAGGGLPEHQLKKLPLQERELAAGLGVEPHVIEAVLNHVSGHKSGVAGIYNRATYPREKKVALDLWADRLIAIVESRPTKVTPLRRGA
jgi:integrase